MAKEKGSARYVVGHESVPLIYEHRFTKYFSTVADLESWRKHFKAKNIKAAVGKTRLGYALYTEHECIEEESE